jgi:hypothetical protein
MRRITSGLLFAAELAATLLMLAIAGTLLVAINGADGVRAWLRSQPSREPQIGDMKISSDRT